ncbi:MAG: hypothetical protein ACXVDZ_09935 [Bacteroidia bacterium]
MPKEKRKKGEKKEKRKPYKRWAVQGCQGFCKKYYRKAVGDFLQNLFNLDSRCTWDCASPPNFAGVFYLNNCIFVNKLLL